ncbi:MAG: hypothetical protein WC246_01870 [Candidatus Paceibacterota bacterium]|jgi:hypothetical protein
MPDQEFKKKLTVQLSVVAVFVVIVAVFAVLFELNISRQVDELVSLKKQRAVLQNSSQNLSQLLQDAKEARGYESAVSALVPTKDQVLLVQKSLQELGTSQGVSINITFGQESKVSESGMESISFTATAEGPFSGIFNFLRMLQTQYPYISIATIDLTAQNNRGSFAGMMLFSSQ